MSKSIYINEYAKKQIYKLQDELLNLDLECSHCIVSSSKFYSPCKYCLIGKKIDKIENSISYFKELLDKNV